jgi:hypothetical protein
MGEAPTFGFAGRVQGNTRAADFVMSSHRASCQRATKSALCRREKTATEKRHQLGWKSGIINRPRFSDGISIACPNCLAEREGNAE